MEDNQSQSPESAQQTAAPSPFGQDAWTETLPQASTTDATQTVDAPATTDAPEVTVTPETTDEILSPNEWLKRELEVDDIEVIKSERAQYKEWKEKGLTAAEIKFENEKSKQVHELLRAGKVDDVVEIYNTQKKIQKVLAADVNKDTAAEIIKLGMSLKYKDLTADEINHRYNKEYGLPKEPTQKSDELDEEFADRKADWQSQYNDKVTDMIIQAKLTKPDIVSANESITLPELEKQAAAAYQPTQEELDRYNNAVADFSNKVDDDLKSLNELSVTFKDEAVEITSAYALSNEEKSQISTQLKRFAEENFNANSLFADRWVNKDGTLNVSRMTRDLARLNADEKIDQKFAQDAATKRLVQYRKETGNINVTGTSQQTFDQQQNGKQSVSPFSVGAWSEKPPTFTN